MKANGPGQSTHLLFDIVEILNSQNIKYAVIGALAVAVHGVVRASTDADALISADSHALNRLKEHCKNQGLKVDLRAGDSADPIPAMLIVSDAFDNRVDLLLGLRGLDYAAYDRTVEIFIAGHSTPLRVIGREDLVAMKLFAGGPQDLVDARRIVATAGDDLDCQLVRKLSQTFGREALQHCNELLGK